MKPKVVHVLPVFTSLDEPGWLILTRKKSDPVAEHFESVRGMTWEAPVKSWFVPHERLTDALDAVDFATNSSSLFCADCKDGSPCEAWAKIARVDYLVRPPEETEETNRPRRQYADVLFLWRDVVNQEALREQYARMKEKARWAHGTQQKAQQEERMRARNAANGRVVFDAFEAFFQSFFNSRAVAVGPPPAVREAAQTLGVSWPCTKDALNLAFRKAAFAAHPDRGGSTAQMAKINGARDLLLKQFG